jgi:hypothetical protein
MAVDEKKGLAHRLSEEETRAGGTINAAQTGDRQPLIRRLENLEAAASAPAPDRDVTGRIAALEAGSYS